MFELGIVTHFEAAHRLIGDFGRATQLHGHTYRVEVAIRGSSIRADGTLFDVGMLKQAMLEATAALDYHDLDEVEGFERRNTTVEVVAQYLFTQIAPHVEGRGGEMLVVRVWESPEAYGSYEGRID